MKKEKSNSASSETSMGNGADQTGSFIYRVVEKSHFLSGMARKGGISFKFAAVISVTLLLIIAMFVALFTAMSSKSLMSANDVLCKTIAGNISATESILTAEEKTMKRSLILQDTVSGLVKSRINGLEFAAVYDLMGKLVEQERAYAAHTDYSKRAMKMPDQLYEEIKNVNDFQKKRILLADRSGSRVPCFQYRLPFKFFNVRVGVIEIVFSEESVIGPVRKARTVILLVGGVLLLIGILISMFVAKGMVSPIRRLSDGMTRVRDGDLDVRMDVQRHDEIGDLSADFNNMIMHLREKLQMQKFVSKSTISMIREQTASGDIGLGGTRQNFAFLFSDVRGFTAMSEKMEPEEVVSILNEYLDLQAQIIKKNHGDIDKFVGDEVMAVFSGNKRADNAAVCAIEIIRAIESLNRRREGENLKTISVGIGLNMGDVVHGRMGSSDRMDNTSIGDTVNLAARLCSQAEPGTIIASRNIIANVTKGKFKGKKLEPIRVKGKANPIEIYEITGMK